MVIDRSHLRWCISVSFLFMAASVAYVYYVQTTPGGPRGGSWQGLTFGIVGTLLMIAAGLLAARKKLPRTHLGTARAWLKGHIWLGLLSFPLILFHAGFRWGGPVEQILMVLFMTITFSGIVGVFIQSQLPRIMKVSVPAEAMYEQVPSVCAALRAKADAEVAQFCEGLTLTEPTQRSGNLALESTTDVRLGSPQEKLNDFYVRQLRPFLQVEIPPGIEFRNESRAAALFARTRAALPIAAESELGRHAQMTLNMLEEIYHERRQLAGQVRLHHWMHGWLFLHVPLSLALLVFAIAHIVMSMLY